MNLKFSSDVTFETVEKLEKERNHLEEQWKKFNEDLRPLFQGKKNNELPNLKLDLVRNWRSPSSS